MLRKEGNFFWGMDIQGVQGMAVVDEESDEEGETTWRERGKQENSNRKSEQFAAKTKRHKDR